MYSSKAIPSFKILRTFAILTAGCSQVCSASGNHSELKQLGNQGIVYDPNALKEIKINDDSDDSNPEIPMDFLKRIFKEYSDDFTDHRKYTKTGCRNLCLPIESTLVKKQKEFQKDANLVATILEKPKHWLAFDRCDGIFQKYNETAAFENERTITEQEKASMDPSSGEHPRHYESYLRDVVKWKRIKKFLTDQAKRISEDVERLKDLASELTDNLNKKLPSIPEYECFKLEVDLENIALLRYESPEHGKGESLKSQCVEHVDSLPGAFLVLNVQEAAEGGEFVAYNVEKHPKSEAGQMDSEWRNRFELKDFKDRLPADGKVFECEYLGVSSAMIQKFEGDTETQVSEQMPPGTLVMNAPTQLHIYRPKLFPYIMTPGAIHKVTPVEKGERYRVRWEVNYAKRKGFIECTACKGSLKDVPKHFKDIRPDTLFPTPVGCGDCGYTGFVQCSTCNGEDGCKECEEMSLNSRKGQRWGAPSELLKADYNRKKRLMFPSENSTEGFETK